MAKKEENIMTIKNRFGRTLIVSESHGRVLVAKKGASVIIPKNAIISTKK